MAVDTWEADPTAAERDDRTVLRGVGGRLAVMAAVAVLATAGYLLLDVRGDWGFALQLRVEKVAAMLLVAYAIGLSTVLFQTVTDNRILTPGIMGFDSLFVLIQSVAVYALGTIAVVSAPASLRFLVECGLMTGFAVVLYRLLLGRGRDVHVLVLAGIIVGTLFQSGSQLVNRLIDPNEFQTLQDLLFASFNTFDESLLPISAVVVALASVAVWRSRDELDVVALGRDVATALGVDHRRAVRRQLVVVAVMVSVATALVGPLTFFGLLVANLARQLLGTFRHRVVLPGAVLLGVVFLVGGQLVLERVLDHGTALAVVVNLVGGVYFIALLLREARRP